MKRVRRFFGFAWTLVTSALNEWRLTGRIKWRTAPAIFSALFPGRPVDRSVGSEWWRRMRGCQRCPIYDRGRLACGLLGQTFQRGDEILPLGCGCWIPGKASLEESTCWLFTETDGASGVNWQSRKTLGDKAPPL